MKTTRRYSLTKLVLIALIIILAGALIISVIGVRFISTETNEKNYEDIISATLTDVESDIKNASDEDILELAGKIRDALETGSYDLNQLAESTGVSEISIVDSDNVITDSSISENIGTDLDNSMDLRTFNFLNHGGTQQVQMSRTEGYEGLGDASHYKKYAGVPLNGGGYVLTALAEEKFQSQIEQQIGYIAVNRHIGNTGYFVVTDSDGELISTSDRIKTHLLKLPEEAVSKFDVGGSKFRVSVNGEDCLCMTEFTNGYYLVGIVPYSEVQSVRDRTTFICAIIETIVFAILFVVMYFLINRFLVSKFRNVARSLGKIAEGDLDTEVTEDSSREFYNLSNDINTTVAALKDYSEREKARITEDMELARTVQYSVLPDLAPVVEGQDRFDLYATMDTAKQVGGDFYDFYRIGEDKLAILCADVSGKGVPAAMFMMNCKTLLKDLSRTFTDPGEIFNKANRELSRSNVAGMFVTVWMGIIDLKTGHVAFANAGHKHPIVYNEKGEFEVLKCKRNFVLTGRAGIEYQTQSFDIRPGDRIYLYTDGVTEAENSEGAQYGTDRLLDYLNKNRKRPPGEILEGLRSDLNDFEEGTEQFDDITMLIFEYSIRN